MNEDGKIPTCPFCGSASLVRFSGTCNQGLEQLICAQCSALMPLAPDAWEGPELFAAGARTAGACPFCNSQGMLRPVKPWELNGEGGTQRYRWTCCKCGAAGPPVGGSADEVSVAARRAWERLKK